MFFEFPSFHWSTQVQALDSKTKSVESLKKLGIPSRAHHKNQPIFRRWLRTLTHAMPHKCDRRGKTLWRGCTALLTLQVEPSKKEHYIHAQYDCTYHGDLQMRPPFTCVKLELSETKKLLFCFWGKPKKVHKGVYVFHCFPPQKSNKRNIFPGVASHS